MALIIPATTPFKFIVNTGTGSANEGQFIPFNEPYPIGQQICQITYPYFEQCYRCEEATGLQVFYDGAKTIAFFIRDASGNIVSGWLPAEFQDYWSAEVEFGALVCPACYTMEVATVSASAAGIPFPDGDNGTMEANINNILTGTENGIAQSGAQFHTGSFSALVKNLGTIATDANIACYGDTVITLVQNTYYTIAAWVYVPNSLPFVTATGVLRIAIDTEWTDAVILEENTYSQADGMDTWVQISTTFVCGADTKGKVVIRADTPAEVTPLGNLWVDDITMASRTTQEEATSEPFAVAEDCPCTLPVEYTSTVNEMGTEFENSGITYLLRAPLTQTHYTNESDTEVWRDSAGTRHKVFSSQSLKVEYRVDNVPDWFMQKLALAMNHDIVRISYVPVVMEQDMDIDEDETTAVRTALMEVYLSDYNYLNSGC